MDSRASFASQESTTTHNKMNARRRPLHTCAASILGITQRACTIAQGLNGPLGFIISMLTRFAILAGPIGYAIRYQWIVMAVLKFVDDRILAVEAMIERAYPPSSIVFNKMDDLVGVTESLPRKLDEAVDKVPTYTHHATFLDWVLVYAISVLKFMITRLSNWRISRGAKEKEIMVDNTSCCDQNNNEHAAAEYHPKGRPKEYPREHPKKPSTNIAPNFKGPTYKEVLTKDTKQGTTEKKEEKKNKREEINNKKAEKKNNKKEEVESAADDDDNEDNDGYSTQDPILDLFDSAWLMKPGKNAKGNYTPRSVSFTF